MSASWSEDAPRRGALRLPSGRGAALLGLGGLLASVAVLSLGLGAASISPGQVVAILGAKVGVALPWSFEASQEAVLWSIRLPRVLLGALVGGGLGIAGAALQGMFRNPLADPGLIGVSSGGALGAALLIVAAPGAWLAGLGGLGLPAAATLGGLLAALVVWRLGQRAGQVSAGAMLLAGIAINALCGAVIGLLTFLADEASLRSLTVWTLGSLSGATWEVVALVAPWVALGAGALLRDGPGLNALLLGEGEALHLGVDVARLKGRVVLLGALIVGAGVGFTGIIGFVGLVTPHLLRMAFGPDHRLLLPGSALLGAALLLGADLVARVAAAPVELPLGVITALLGAPFFLGLMMRRGAEVTG